MKNDQEILEPLTDFHCGFHKPLPQNTPVPGPVRARSHRTLPFKVPEEKRALQALLRALRGVWKNRRVQHTCGRRATIQKQVGSRPALPAQIRAIQKVDGSVLLGPLDKIGSESTLKESQLTSQRQVESTPRGRATALPGVPSPGCLATWRPELPLLVLPVGEAAAMKEATLESGS